MTKAELHEAACPGCGCEPEVSVYYKRAGEYVGYHCSCRAIIIDGRLQGMG